MSTIEKAAARLVKKPKSPDGQAINLAAQTNKSSSTGSSTNRVEPLQYEQTCELDFVLLRDNGFLVPGHDNAKQSQEFRRIKRPLFLNLPPALEKR